MTAKRLSLYVSPPFVRVAFLTGALVLGGVLIACPAPGKKSATIEIPFELARNQVLLEAGINDHGPLNVILDTAGDPSAIDLVTADSIEIFVDRGVEGEASGVGSRRVPMYPARIVGLMLDGHSFSDVEALALDLSHVADRFGQPLHGILGHSFLKGRIVQIDYPQRTLRFFADSSALTDAEPSPPILVVPMEFAPDDIAPLVEVFVNGHPVKVTIDTGSSLGLELFGAAVQRLGLEDARSTGVQGTVVGARGEAEIRKLSVDSLRLGGHTILDAEVAFRDWEEPGPRDGNLGNQVLQDFVLTLDYLSGTLSLALPPSE